jgi:hypothetical protein
MKCDYCLESESLQRDSNGVYACAICIKINVERLAKKIERAYK